LGGICGLVLSIGLARFAYTPLLPALQLQTGLTDASAGALAAIHYAGYITGTLAAVWIAGVRWRHRLSFVSSNTSVLTVSGTTVTAVAPGAAAVAVGGASASLAVTATPVAVSALSAFLLTGAAWAGVPSSLALSPAASFAAVATYAQSLTA